MINPIYHRQAELLLRCLPIVMEVNEFSLKGGTAINFFVRDLPRLSVDIDLCYTPILDRKTSLAGITDALARMKHRIGQLINESQFSEIISPEFGSMIKLIVRWQGTSIKIEPNFIQRGTVFPVVERTLSASAVNMFETAVDCRTLSDQDLFGGKICAALDRQHPRDLLDIKILLENEGITDSIRRAFIVYLISHPRPMSVLLAPNLKDISSVYKTEFEEMTFEKVTLIELIETRKILIDQIHRDLTDIEKKFILSVKIGEPEWELLEIDHIRDLPAVKWKVLNISGMEKNKHKKAIDKLREILNL